MDHGRHNFFPPPISAVDGHKLQSGAIFSMSSFFSVTGLAMDGHSRSQLASGIG